MLNGKFKNLMCDNLTGFEYQEHNIIIFYSSRLFFLIAVQK